MPVDEAKVGETAEAAGLRSGTQGRLDPPSIFVYVDAVARHGSIRRAAEALHIASSALNRRILDLEEQVGTPLFERLPRGVRATAAGEVLLAFVRRSLKEMQLVEAQIEGLRGLVRGSVRVAVAESVIGRMLPDAIGAFQAKHSGVCFSVTVDGPRRLAKLLLRDSVDLILTHESGESADIDVLGALPQPLCALISREHPLATRTTLRLVDCLDYPLALPDESLAARRLLDVAAERASVRLEPALVTNSIEMTKIFARSRQGVCFSFLIGTNADSADMVAVPLSDPDLANGRLLLAGRRGRVLPVAAAAFAEGLAQFFETL